MKKKQTFLMYKDWDLFIDNLTDAQAGKLLKAIYAKENGRAEDVPDDIAIIFQYISKKIEENEEKYRVICEKRKAYGAIRHSKPNESISKHKVANESISKHKVANAGDTDTETVTDTATDTETGTGTDTGMDTDINNDNMAHSIQEKIIADLTTPKFIKLVR